MIPAGPGARRVGRRLPVMAVLVRACLVGLSWLALSCSATDHERLPGLYDDADGVVPREPCQPGDRRACSETVHRESGVLTCRDGHQVCDDAGYWGTCVGTMTKRPDPFSVDHSKFFKTFSLSSPIDCNPSNACDPRCQMFAEEGPFGPGVDAGSTVDWSEGPTPTWTAPNCGVSDLCSVHTSPLPPDCDPCVESICANPLTAKCCSTSWDQDCVNAVYLICGDGTLPGPPNGGFCDWGALSDGPIRLGNNGVSGTRIGGNGASTDKVLLEASTGACTYADIITTATVDLRNNCTVTGDILSTSNIHLESNNATTPIHGMVHAGGYIELRNGVQVKGGTISGSFLDLAASSSTYVEQSAIVGGNLTLGNNASIKGDAQVVGNVNAQAGASVTGTLLYGGTSNLAGTQDTNLVAPAPPVLQIPFVSDLDRDLDLDCSEASSKGTTYHNSGTQLTLEPGVYGAIQLEGTGSDLVLLPGDYVFTSLQFRSNADLRFIDDTVPPEEPKWDISTCGKFDSTGANSFVVSPWSAQPAANQLLIYSDSTNVADPYAIRFGPSADIDATLIAPHGRIYLGSNATLDGFLWGADVYTEAGSRLNQGGAAPCEAMDLWGAACLGSDRLYDDDATFALDAEAHYGDVIYRCIDPALCDAGGADYWPGKGTDWTQAWEVVAQCLSKVLPDPAGGSGGPVECPVDLTAAGALWSTPCSSGRDCQVDHRCENAYTDPSCGHSTCERGAFLSLGCDPCVDLICDPDGDGASSDPCCTDSGSGAEWDDSCIARVETECDASCGFSNGCEHDLCAVGGGIETTGCHPCVSVVCAARPSCCTEDGSLASDEWDATCVDLVHSSCGAKGQSICEFAVFAPSNVQTSDGCNISGGSIGGDQDGLYLQYGCSVQDVYAASQVVLYDTLAGDVYSSGAVTALGSTSVGSANESITLQLPSIPVGSFSCSADPSDDQDFGTTDGSHALSPGSYREVVLLDDGAGADNAIELSAGSYDIDSLELGDGTKLLLPDAGEVEINICAALNIGENVVFEAASGTLTAPDALRIVIRVAGEAVTIGQGSSVFGVLSAPDATVSVSSAGATVATTVHGMIWADEVRLFDGAIVDASGAAGAACHNAGLGEPPPSSCPVTTPLTMALDQSGSCVENVDDVQAYCPGVDLTLGAACDEQIPICNRGMDDFSGSVDLTFWPETAKQMATESPDSTGASGTCPFSGTIPSGRCVTHDCAGLGLTAETSTVMVNAPDAMGDHSVSECSTLDNWTVFTTGNACADVCLSPPCTASLQTEVIVEEYTALCPENMAPKWVTLGWDTTLLGDAAALFEAVSVQPGANTEYAALVELGPTPEPPDSPAVCPWDAACAVDLALSLGLGNANHPETIYLRVTLTPDGEDSATLNAWDVTYSCEYDQ